MNRVLSLWQRSQKWPLGERLFTWMVCRRAPYFGSARPRILELRPNYCQAVIAKRRRVENHIRTVHVIAICNGLELAMGVMAEASIPSHLRWIPKGMSVDYTARAGSDITVTAELPEGAWEQGPDVPVAVTARRADGEVVVRGQIHLWVTPRQPG